MTRRPTRRPKTTPSWVQTLLLRCQQLAKERRKYPISRRNDGVAEHDSKVARRVSSERRSLLKLALLAAGAAVSGAAAAVGTGITKVISDEAQQLVLKAKDQFKSYDEPELIPTRELDQLLEIATPILNDAARLAAHANRTTNSPAAAAFLFLLARAATGVPNDQDLGYVSKLAKSHRSKAGRLALNLQVSRIASARNDWHASMAALQTAQHDNPGNLGLLTQQLNQTQFSISPELMLSPSRWAYGLIFRAVDESLNARMRRISFCSPRPPSVDDVTRLLSDPSIDSAISHVVFSRWQMHIAGLARMEDVNSELTVFDRILDLYDGAQWGSHRGNMTKFRHNQQVAMAFMIAHHGWADWAVERLRSADHTFKSELLLARTQSRRENVSSFQRAFAKLAEARLLVRLGQDATDCVNASRDLISQTGRQAPELLHGLDRLNSALGESSASLDMHLGGLGARQRLNYVVFPRAGIE